MLGILVASAALITILSAFNGLEKLVLEMYSSFSSEIRIEPSQGKSFNSNTPVFQKLKGHPAVAEYQDVLQEKVLLRYGRYQYIGTLKGLDRSGVNQAKMDSLMWDGEFLLQDSQMNYAVLGAAVYANLGISLVNSREEIEVFSPKKGVTNAVNPSDEFTSRIILPSGVLRAQQQFDDLIIVPISFARDVLSQYEEVSAVELSLKRDAGKDRFQQQLQDQLGSGYVVKNRVQQNPALYKLLNTEKWGVFFILTFVLVIASFNIVGSLTMLVIDKQRDIAILNSLGADKQLIQRIFFFEGMLISMIGCVVGLVLGFMICIVQIHFGLIKMGAANLVTDVYPVHLAVSDFVLVFFTVLVVSGIASLISARLSVRHNSAQLKAAAD